MTVVHYGPVVRAPLAPVPLLRPVPALRPFPPPAPRLRCSDDDREKVAGLLGRHFATGRLRLAEYEERLERAWAAIYLDQLPTLFADLPLEPEEPSAPAHRPAPRRHVCLTHVGAATGGAVVAGTLVVVLVVLFGAGAAWATAPAIVLGGLAAALLVPCRHRR